LKKDFRTKRIYEKYSREDGARILVDRLWARGLTKEAARLDDWIKDIAPSDALRKWYSHDPAKWDEFREKYFKELEDKKDLCRNILSRKENVITLLYSSKEQIINNAAALKEFLEKMEVRGS